MTLKYSHFWVMVCHTDLGEPHMFFFCRNDSLRPVQYTVHSCHTIPIFPGNFRTTFVINWPIWCLYWKDSPRLQKCLLKMYQFQIKSRLDVFWWIFSSFSVNKYCDCPNTGPFLLYSQQHTLYLWHHNSLIKL